MDGTTHARSKRALQFQAACEVCRLYLETYLLTVYLTTAQSTALVTKENNEQKQVRSIEGGLGRGGQETGGGGGQDSEIVTEYQRGLRRSAVEGEGRRTHGPPHSRVPRREAVSSRAVSSDWTWLVLGLGLGCEGEG